MQLPSDKDVAWFERQGVKPPTHEEHGLQDTFERPLSAQLLQANPRNWHLEGNLLKCDTDFGPLSQTIPTDYICLGDGKDGLPILKKVG